MHEIMEAVSVSNITFNALLLIEAMQIISPGINTANEYIWTSSYIEYILKPFEYVQVTHKHPISTFATKIFIPEKRHIFPIAIKPLLPKGFYKSHSRTIFFRFTKKPFLKMAE